MKSLQTLIIGILLFALNATALHAQEQKSARLALSYINDNLEGAYIKAKVRYKEDKTYFPAQDLQLNLYKIAPQDDEEDTDIAEKIEASNTDENGESRFYLNPKNFGTDEQFYEVRIENDANFTDKSEDIHFKTADITANISKKDSIHNLNIKFVDAENNPIPNQYLTIKLKRLFGLMNVGDEDFYKTDDSGEIALDIDEKIYSKSGNIEFMIKLDESDDYGTIIETVKADFGIVMESKDTFNERTMWASAAKAPLYILIIPNVLLVGIWGIILGLIFNLYRIYKNS